MCCRITAFRLVVLYATCATGPAPAAAAAPELTPAAAAARLVGTWDATPALDEDVLQADPGRDPRHARASAIGVRIVYAFDRDGTMTLITLTPSGQDHPNTANRLVVKRTSARWSVARPVGTGKGLALRISRETNPGVSEHALTFDGEDAFTAEVYDLHHLAFRSPFAFRRNIGDRALSWIRANHAAGRSNAALAADMAATITAIVNKQDDFCIRLGPGITRSGKATELHGFCENLVVHELSDADAEHLKLRGLAVSVVRLPRGDDVYPVLSEARVSEGPQFDAPGGRLDLTKPVTGHLAFHTPNTMPRAQYTARLTLLMDRSRVSLFEPTLPDQHVIGKGTFSVKVPAEHAGYAGPVVVFADLCRETKFAQGVVTMEVLSPPAVVRFQAGARANTPE